MNGSMMPDAKRLRLRDFIAEKLGLHFPPERWADLERGLIAATEEFGFSSVSESADWLLSEELTNQQLQVLASHLTVGETYFFRDKRMFDVLADSVLPGILRARRGGRQGLRVWSAACCTGEEPYSLAILLNQIIPDIKDWQVTILGTDISDRFLRRAAQGVYGEWSFRGSPAWFKERNFQRTTGGGYSILPEIKERVKFTQLNLVEDPFPALVTDANAMDIIFCRNVLMYFTAVQVRKVVRNLSRSLVDGGWLVVSPVEASQTLLSGFIPITFQDAILYQKKAEKDQAEATRPLPFVESPCAGTTWSHAPLPLAPPLTEVSPLASPPAAREDKLHEGGTPLALATTLYHQGNYEAAMETLMAAFSAQDASDPRALALLARALANQGKHTDALTWCDRWVAVNKLDASAHYLRAVVLEEAGDSGQARRSLHRAIYIDPSFVLAHFALGNLSRKWNRRGESEKHFAIALHLLGECPSDDVLPESSGLTAGRLREIITSIRTEESSA